MDSSITRGSSPDDPDEEDDLGLIPNGNAEKNKYIDSVIEEALRGMLDKKRSNSSNVRATNDLGSESGIKGECDISSSKSVSVDHNVHFSTDHQYGYVEATPEEILHSNEITVNDNNESFFERSEDSDQGSDVLFTEGVLDDLSSRNDCVEELLSPDKCVSVKNLKEDRTFVKNAKNKNLSRANSLKSYYESAVFNLVDDNRNDSQETSFLPSENNNLTDAPIPVLINENEVEIPPYDADRPIPKLTPQIIVGVVPPSNHENNLNIDNQVSHVSGVPISNKKQESFHTANLKHGGSKTVANSTILNGFTDKSEYTNNEVNMWSRISSGNHFRIQRKGIKNSSNDDYIIPIARPINKKNIKNNTHNCSVFTVKTDNILIEERKEGLCSPTNKSTFPSMPILVEETQKPIKSNKGETSIKLNDKNMGRKQTPTHSTATPLRLFQRSLIKELSSSPLNNNKKSVHKRNKNSKPDKHLLSGQTTTDNTVFPEKHNLTNDKKTIGLDECENQSEINSNIEINNFLLRKNELNEDTSKHVIKEDLGKKQLNNVIEKNIYSSVLETDTFDLLTDLDPEKTQTNLHDESVHSLDPFIKTNVPTADILEAMPVASILDEGLKSDLLGEGQESTLEDNPLSILNFFDKDLNCSSESVEKNKLIDIIEEAGSKNNTKEVSYLISSLDAANYDKSKSEVLGNYSSVDYRQKISPFTTTAPESKEYDENNIISDIEKIDQIIDRELSLSDSESTNPLKTHDLNDDRAAGNVIENNLQQDSSHAKPELPQDRVNLSSEVIVDSFNSQLSCKHDDMLKLEENIDQTEKNQIDRKHSLQKNILGTDGKTINTSMSNKGQKSNSSRPQVDGNDYLEDISDGDFEIDDLEDSKLPTWNKSTARNAPNNQKNTLSRSHVPNSSKNQGNKKVFLQRGVTTFRSGPYKNSLKDSSFNTSSAHRNKNTYISSGFRKKARVPEKRYDFNSRKPLQEGQKNLKPLQVKSMGKQSPNSETSKTTSVVNKKSVASEQLDLISNGRVSPSKTVGVDLSCRRHKNLIINIEDNICKRMQEDKVNFSNSKTTISLSQLEGDLSKKLPDNSFLLSKSNTVKKNRSEDSVIVGGLTVTKEIELSPTVNKKQVVKSPQHNKRNELKGKKASLEETVKKLVDSCVLKLENRNAVSESDNSDSILSCSSKIETEIIHDNLDAQLEMELSSGKYNSIFEQSKHMKFEHHKENACSSNIEKFVCKSMQKCADLSMTADENLSDSRKKEICSNVSNIIIEATVTSCSANDLDVCKKKTGIEHQMTDQISPVELPIVANKTVINDKIAAENQNKLCGIDIRIDENHKPVSAATTDNLVPNHLDDGTITENKDSIKNLSGRVQKSVGSINDEKILQTSLSKLEVPNDVEINKNISVVGLVNPQNISLANNLSKSQKNTIFKNLATDHIEPFIDFNNSNPLNKSSKLESQKQQSIENVGGDANVINFTEATNTAKETHSINNEIAEKSPNIVSFIPTVSDNENVTGNSYPEKPCKDSLDDDTNIINVTDATETTKETSYFNNEITEQSPKLETVRDNGNGIDVTVQVNTEMPPSIESVDGDRNVINVTEAIESTKDKSSINNEITEKLLNVETIIPTLNNNEISTNVTEKSHPEKPPSIESVGGDPNVINVTEATDTAEETSMNNEITEKSNNVDNFFPTLSDDGTNITKKTNSENPPGIDNFGNETNVINVTEATKTANETHSISNEIVEKSKSVESIISTLSDNGNSTVVPEKSHPEKLESIVDGTTVINVAETIRTTEITSTENNKISEKTTKLQTVRDNENSANIIEKTNSENPPGIDNFGNEKNVINVTEATKTANETHSISNEIVEKSKSVESIVSTLSDNGNSTVVPEKSHPEKLESIVDGTTVINVAETIRTTEITSTENNKISEKTTKLQTVRDNENSANIIEKTNPENPSGIDNFGNETNVINVTEATKTANETHSISNEIVEKSKSVESIVSTLSDNGNSTVVPEKSHPEKLESIVDGTTVINVAETIRTTEITSTENNKISEKTTKLQTVRDNENSANIIEKTNPENPSGIDNFGNETNVINVTEATKTANETHSISNEIVEKSKSVESIVSTLSDNGNSTVVPEKSHPEKLESIVDGTTVINVAETIRTTEITSTENNKISEKTTKLQTVRDNENSANIIEKTNSENPPGIDNFGNETNVINVTKATKTANETHSISNEIVEKSKSVESIVSTLNDNGNSTVVPEKSHPEKLESIDGTSVINVAETIRTTEITSTVNNKITEKTKLQTVSDNETSANIIEKTNPEMPPSIESVGEDINVTEANAITNETSIISEKSHSVEAIIPTPAENQNITTVTTKSYTEKQPSAENFGNETNVIHEIDATETSKETSLNNEITEGSNNKESFIPTVRGNENSIDVAEKSHPEKPPNIENVSGNTNVINVPEAVNTTEEKSSLNNEITEKSPRLETVRENGNGTNIIEKINSEMLPSIESVNDDINVINVPDATPTTNETFSINNEFPEKSHKVETIIPTLRENECSTTVTDISPNFERDSENDNNIINKTNPEKTPSVESFITNLKENENSTNVTEISSPKLEIVSASGNSANITKKSSPENPTSIEIVSDDTNVINAPDAAETSKQSFIQNEITEKSPDEVSFIPTLSDNENVTEKSYPEKPPCKESLDDDTNIINVINASKNTKETSFNNEITEKSPNVVSFIPTPSDNENSVTEKSYPEKLFSTESHGDDTNLIKVTETTNETSSINNEITEKSHSEETIIPTLSNNEITNVTEKSHPEKPPSIESVGGDPNVINVTETSHEKTAFINNEIIEKSTETLATTEIASTLNNKSVEKTPRLETLSDSENSANNIKKTNPENPPCIESVGDDTNVINDPKATKITPIDNEISEKSDNVDSIIPNLRENENNTNLTEKSYPEKIPSTEAVSNDINVINVPEAIENTKKTSTTKQNLNENSIQRQNLGNINPSDIINENSMSAGKNTGKLPILGSVSQIVAPNAAGNLSGIKENVNTIVIDGENNLNVTEKISTNAEKPQRLECVNPTNNDDKQDINMVKSNIDNKHIIGMKQNICRSPKHINFKRNHVKRKKLLHLTKREGSIDFKEGNPTEVINNKIIGSESVKRPDDSQPSLISSAGLTTETHSVCLSDVLKSVGEDKVAEEPAVDVSSSSSSTVLENTESGPELNNVKTADGITLHHLANSSSKVTSRNLLENCIETNISEDNTNEENDVDAPAKFNTESYVASTDSMDKSYKQGKSNKHEKVVEENHIDCNSTMTNKNELPKNMPLKNTNIALESKADGNSVLVKNVEENLEYTPVQDSGSVEVKFPLKNNGSSTDFSGFVKNNKKKFIQEFTNYIDSNKRVDEKKENPSTSVINENSTQCKNQASALVLGSDGSPETNDEETESKTFPLPPCSTIDNPQSSGDTTDSVLAKNIGEFTEINTGSHQNEKDQLPVEDCHGHGKFNSDFSVGNDELEGHSNSSLQVSKNSASENKPLISNDADADTITVDNQGSSQSEAANNLRIQPLSKSTVLKDAHIDNGNSKEDFQSGSYLNKRTSNTKNEKLVMNCVNFTLSNPVHSKTVHELSDKFVLKEVKILVKKINPVNTSKINLATNVESTDHKSKRQILGHNESVKRTRDTSMHDEERPTKILLLNSPKLVDPSFVDRSKKTQGRINLRSKTTIPRKEETKDNTGRHLFPLLSRLNSFRSIYECMDENNVKRAFISSNVYNLLKKDTCFPSKYSHLEIICTKSVERNSRFKRRRRKSPLLEMDDESDNRNPSSMRLTKRARQDKGPNSIETHSNFIDPSFPSTNNDRSTKVNSQSESSFIHERIVTSSTNLTTGKRLYEPEISNETVPKHLKVGGSVKETLLNVVRKRLNQAAEPPEDEDDSDDDFMGFERELPCGCSVESNRINQSCAVNCFIRRANFKLCYLNRTIKLSSKHYSSRRNERYRTFRPSRQESGRVEDDVRDNKSMQLPDEASASVKPFQDPGICFMSLGRINLKNEQSFNLEGSNYSGLDSSNNFKVPDNKRKRRFARLGTKPSSVTETDKNNEEDSDSSS